MTAAEPRRSLAPVVLGIVLTCLLLFFIGYAASRRRAAQTAAPPQLVITGPASGDVVDSPLVVRFTTARPIALGSDGWGFESLHLHAWINGIQHMPAAADIRALGRQSYEWTLDVRPLDQLELHLGWADQAHRALTAGSSDTISLRIE